jgi:uncharacterized protein (TIGR04168 family)
VFGVRTSAESVRRICDAASAAPKADVVVMVGHNGPAGLGTAAHDICGVDFRPAAGDHGDPDLAAALAVLHDQGRCASTAAHSLRRAWQ